MNIKNYFIIVRKLIKNAHHEIYWRAEIAIIDHQNNRLLMNGYVENILLVH